MSSITAPQPTVQVLFISNAVKVHWLSVSQLQHDSANIWTTSYSKTAVQTHVITVSVWWQYFLLSLWSFGRISYTVVITRLQVAESSRTSTTLFVSRLQQAQYK